MKKSDYMQSFSMLKKQFPVGFLHIFFLASVFLLALIKIEDHDVWIHLSFGRLIWNLKGFPSTEPFLFTMQGQPFSYSSWLFGVIYYAAYQALNVYGVILLKAITVTTLFYILLRDSLRPFNNTTISILALSFAVIMIRPRFVERPDTFMMVFLAFSIFCLNAYIYNDKKYIYALPFVHMIWANMHSSIPIMVVPFMAFVVGGFLQRYIPIKGSNNIYTPSLTQLKTITFIFLASFAASLISPYFINQYFFGASFLTSSKWYVLNIPELYPPTWKTMKWPFILSPIVILSFILIGKRVSLIHLFLVIPFIGLSFTASRFAFILCIVACPIVVRNIGVSLAGAQWWYKFSTKTLVLVGITAWIILYPTLILAKVDPFVDSHVVDTKLFGFGINYDRYPEGSLHYMDMRNITGRMFNHFGWGQYIAWRDYPLRKAFIDGRGYLRRDLLETMSDARYNAELFDVLYKSYGFESVLIDYPDPESARITFGNNSALSNPGWALVYWDDLSLIYLKRGGQYDSIINEDEYRFINPANNMSSIMLLLEDENNRTNLVRELKRNIEQTGSSKAYAFLGSIYNKMGLYQQAIEAFSHVRAYPTIQDHLFDSYAGIGYAYCQLGKFDEALLVYRKALELWDNIDFIYFNIGKIYAVKKDKKNAINFLEKTLKINSNNVSAYLLLITLYKDSYRADDAKRMEEQYSSALIRKASEEHNDLGGKALASGRIDMAITEFKKSIELNPSDPSAYSNLGRVYFETGLMRDAYEYQRKALEINPNYAMAYYWLGQIYRNSENPAAAKKYFEEFCKIEPDGYLSRWAKQYIIELDSVSH